MVTLGEIYDRGEVRVMQPCEWCGKRCLINHALHDGAFVKCFSCGHMEALLSRDEMS